MAGRDLDFRRLEGAWAAVSDERLEEYFRALPEEWVEDDDAARKILAYIADIRNHLSEALVEIKLVLS